MRFRPWHVRLVAALCLAVSASASASPWLDPGNLALRHDIQVLADAGVLEGPVTSWPLSWGDILNDIEAYREVESLDGMTSAALLRVRRMGNRLAGRSGLRMEVDARYDTDPGLLRGFEDRAREDTDVTVGAVYMGDRVAVRVNVNGVSSPDDDQDVRLDGSYAGVAIGNYMISAGVMERWWGPGYDGSIILGNNQRPIPAFSIDRNDTAPFRSRWLSWIGPWDMSLVWGQLEDDRVVPNARFLGLRINFRPLDSLEIGLSRSAQWCGSGRPCDFDTLVKIAIGRDNRGDDSVDLTNEPGNQLAGFDVRWAPGFAPLNGAVYGQFIGEDEAGGFPSRWLGQMGLEVSGQFGLTSYRGFMEYAATTCQFYEESARPNCAYNNGIYQTGYRYKGRSIGHTIDNDASMVSLGGIAMRPDGSVWQGVFRASQLNNEGIPDAANTLTPTPLDYIAIEGSWRAPIGPGELEIGAGLSRTEDIAAGTTTDDSRVFFGYRVTL